MSPQHASTVQKEEKKVERLKLVAGGLVIFAVTVAVVSGVMAIGRGEDAAQAMEAAGGSRLVEPCRIRLRAKESARAEEAEPAATANAADAAWLS